MVVVTSVILADEVKMADAVSGEASEGVVLYRDDSIRFKSEVFCF